MRVVTLVHPCRDKSFRKAVSAVMDDLVKVLANKSIEQLTSSVMSQLINLIAACVPLDCFLVG